MSDSIEHILTEELELLRQEIALRQEQTGQTASGQTGGLIETDVHELSAEIGLPAHFYVLENGRAGGKLPEGFQDILQRWAEAKGLDFETEADFNRWAYFVSKKIKEEGSALYRSGMRHDIYSTPFAEFEEHIVDRISSFYLNQIIKKL